MLFKQIFLYYLGGFKLHREAYKRNIRMGRQNYGQIFCTQCGERIGHVDVYKRQGEYIVIYNNVVSGRFVSRPNRFIAIVDVDGAEQMCHVKNTGRCPVSYTHLDVYKRQCIHKRIHAFFIFT